MRIPRPAAVHGSHICARRLVAMRGVARTKLLADRGHEADDGEWGAQAGGGGQISGRNGRVPVIVLPEYEEGLAGWRSGGRELVARLELLSRRASLACYRSTFSSTDPGNDVTGDATAPLIGSRGVGDSVGCCARNDLPRFSLIPFFHPRLAVHAGTPNTFHRQLPKWPISHGRESALRGTRYKPGRADDGEIPAAFGVGSKG